MIFFPYQADFTINRAPIWTILIMVLCVGVHIAQQNSFGRIMQFAETFCTEDRPRGFWLAMDRVTGQGNPAGCAQAMFTIHREADHAAVIKQLADRAKPYQTISVEAGRRRNTEELTETYESFRVRVPKDLTSSLVYHPRSFNVATMISATFAHADWQHLIGNLFFFFAFAAAVEAILGAVLYPLLIVGLSLGTHLAYSAWVSWTGSAVPTLGLSGVVMGVIGMFTFFLPTAGIRCFAWILFWLRSFVIPAWIIMIWFVGWDLYSLSHDDGAAGVNFMAHVSGAVLGLVAGLLLFRRRREEVQADYRMNVRRKG